MSGMQDVYGQSEGFCQKQYLLNSFVYNRLPGLQPNGYVGNILHR